MQQFQGQGHEKPQTDPRFAGVSGLGAFKKLYQSPKRGEWPAWVVMAAFVIAIVIIFTVLDPETRAGSVPVVVLLVIGIVAALISLAGSGWAVAQHEDGFAYRDRNGLRQIRWEDITNLCEKWVWVGDENSSELVPRKRIKTRDGGEITLPAGLDDLWATIKEKRLGSLVDSALAAVGVGKVLDFGPFHVSSEGLRFESWPAKRFARWREIRSVDQLFDHYASRLWMYAVRLEPGGAAATAKWPRLRGDATDEPDVFLALCEHLIRANHAS